jgi:hypothetical protein
MKSIFSLLCAAFVLLAGIHSLSSCKKSGTSSASSFTWTFKDTVYNAAEHKAYLASMATTPIIVASKNPGLRPTPYFVGIQTISFNTGTYTFTSGSSYKLHYVDNQGNDNLATSGSINITSSSANAISGNFSAVIRNYLGETNTITGSFVNTPVEP